MYSVTIIALLFLYENVNGQNTIPGQSSPSGQTSPTGQTICVPIGTCPTGPIPTTPPVGGIDVRIVTPTQIPSCPPGQQPCTITPSVQCGIRYIPPPSEVDGNTVSGAYPWQAYLVNSLNRYIGSGALINPNYVITAAHKVNGLSPGSVRVIMGVWDPTVMTNTQSRTAVAITIHNQFNPQTLINDIAVIRLDSPISIGAQPNIGCVNLPQRSQSFIGRSCTVSGWGDTNFLANDSPTRTQRQVTVPIVDYNTCRNSLITVLPNVDTYLDSRGGEICAGGVAQRDACTNDGGAPLVCPDNGRFTVAGLVIWGKGCGTQGIYGVYVNVAYYRDWIDSVINNIVVG